MPRRACGTARNDEYGFRQPEQSIEALLKKIRPATRQDITTAHYSLLTAHCLSGSLSTALTKSLF
ncbi:MAG: hypothetical protein IKX14_06895 [Neisseriaceae bacterium]|nr:hypothetical protein [Neisseriaceae bacterium]